MKIKVLLIALGLVIVGAAAYFLLKPKGGHLLEYVPIDAMVVVKIDLPELAKVFKENEAEIKKTNLWKKFLEAQKEPMARLVQQIMKDPEASGVDFGEQSFVFVHSTKRGTNFGILVGLKNKSAFTTILKNNAPAGKNVGSEAGVDFAEFDANTYISCNDNAVLISNQNGESHEYFANILNKKGGTPKVDFIKDKIKGETGLIAVAADIDAIFELEKNKLDGEVNNPFPKNTAILANIITEKGNIASDIKFESENGKELEKLNFFKDHGVMEKYEKTLFGSGTPYMAMSISVDMKKMFDFVALAVPKFKQARQDQSIKDAETAMTGDFCFGMTLNKEALQAQKKAMEDRDYSAMPTASPYNFIVKIGLKDAENYMQKYGAMLRKNEDGIYEMSFFFFHAFFLAEKDMLTVSMDADYMKTLKTTGKAPENKSNFKMPDIHKNSALYMAVNSEGLGQFWDILGANRSLRQSANSFFSGTNIAYLDGGVFTSKMELLDKKTHPALLYFRMCDEMVQQMEETEKRMMNNRVEESPIEGAPAVIPMEAPQPL